MTSLLTPTSSSSAIAGAGFWTTIWALVFKADTFAKVVRYRKPVRSKLLDWIGTHPIESITLTEFTNYAIHGVSSPMGVMAALGGTFVNVFVIGGLVIRRVFRRRALQRV